MEKYGMLAGIDLLKLKNLNTGKYCFVWLEVTEFNIAYWSGETDSYTQDLHFPQ
jgi:hypothetical protein